MSLFTLDDALRHCAKATQNFGTNCKDRNLVLTLLNLKYKVRINTRMRTTVGRARKITHKGVVTLIIDLNQKLLSRISDADQFQDVSHELAHILDFVVRGKSAHDDYWQQLHQMMGGDSKRCHAYDTIDLQNRVRKVLLVDTKHNRETLVSKRWYENMYFKLVQMNLVEPGRIKTKWLNPDEVIAWRRAKKNG